MSEQKARIARMTDRSLIDKERFGNQDAAGPESALEFWEERAVEKIYIHD